MKRGLSQCDDAPKTLFTLQRPSKVRNPAERDRRIRLNVTSLSGEHDRFVRLNVTDFD
jgi:hypothetical protein